MKRIVLLLVGVIALVALMLRLLSGSGSPSDARAAGSAAPRSVTGSGIVQPREDVIVSAEVSGRVVALGAEEGDEIEAGALLVRLDDTLMRAQIAQAEADVEAAQANLAGVQAGARAEEVEKAQVAVDRVQAQIGAAEAAVTTATANLRAAEANHDVAKAKLALLTAGPTQSEQALAAQQIDLANDQLWGAQAQRDATKAGVTMPLSLTLHFEGTALGPFQIPNNPVAPRGLDVGLAEAQILKAQTGTRLAQLQQDQLMAGARPQDVAPVRADVDQAQTQVELARLAVEQAQQSVATAGARRDQAQAQLDLLRSGAKSAQVAVARAQLAQAEAAVAILEAQRDKLTLRAPIAGLVTERAIHEGEIATAGAHLFTISTLDPVLLTIYVPEEQLARVQIGQPADVQVDALPGRRFEGEVAYVAARAEFTPSSAQTDDTGSTRVFAVRIKVPNPEGLLKPGMPADATLR